ncbi:MAG TPA: glycosyltransferase family 39 protein [Patescibacteria group bacterium]|nr:glycosyltransferase family 39 protein [Patescibacteria group bacterium]
MSRLKSWVILIVIISFALLVYTFKIGDTPGGVYVDEATVSYNAISILKTGNDEYGMPHPVLFRLFGSYTPPLFIYLAAFTMKFFGSGIIVTRLMSSASALLSSGFLYLFLEKSKILKNRLSIFVVCFFYSVSPWLIFNARLGYETTFAYLLNIVGIYFSYLALKNPKKIILALPILALSAYTAHTQKYLFIIYLFFYLILFGKRFLAKVNRKYFLISLFITILIFIPYLSIIGSPAFWVKNLNFFDPGGSGIVENIILQTLIYFSPKTLFFLLPDIDLQHTIPQISVLYNWMVIPFFTGLYLLFRNFKKLENKFIVFLFIVTIIPAVLSGRFISIQRALPFLFPLILVIGFGIDFFIQKFGRIANVILFSTLTAYSLLNLYRSYFVLFPQERAIAWNWGYDQVAEFIKKNPNKRFLLDNSRNPRNYIELLYFLEYPSDVYQHEVDQVYRNNYYAAEPQIYEYKFGNIEVRNIDWGPDSCLDQIIIGDELTVSDAQMKDHHLKEIYRISDFREKPVFIFYQTGSKPGC